MNSNTKRCNKCGKVKNCSEFYKDKRTSDGLQSRCKPCNNEYVAKWRVGNPERNRKNSAKWREANPDKSRASVAKWAKDNREKRRHSHRLQRDKRRGATTGTHTLAQWNELKKQHGYSCAHCKRTEPEVKLERDHIVPVSKGGTNNIGNIQPLCKPCNRKKGSK